MKTLFLYLTLSLLTCELAAQSGSAGRPYQRTRGLASQSEAYDLPYLTVKTPYPESASDYTTLIVFSPDSIEVGVRIKAWMSGYKALLTKEFRIGPGRQELPIPLYSLAEGAYAIEVLRRDQVVAVKHLEVYR